MPQCDAACMKTIIDTEMGSLAARLYAGVLARLGPQGVARPIDIEAPLFYAGVVDAIKEVALNLNRTGINPERQADLMAQVNDECYRADLLIAWARSESFTAEKLAQWTEKVFEWAKDDQTFYTAFAAETN